MLDREEGWFEGGVNEAMFVKEKNIIKEQRGRVEVSASKHFQQEIPSDPLHNKRLQQLGE